MNVHDVIRAPVVTEKSDAGRESRNEYAFVVDRRATKDQIKLAVKTLFNVTPTDVRTLLVRGKVKRVGRSQGPRSNWKKAIVTLPQGQSIDLFTLGV